MPRKSHLNLLLELLYLDSANGFIKISTNEIADLLGISQQSASRWLMELEGEELIERRNFKIKLTEKAVQELKAVHSLLKKSFEAHAPLVFSGIVTSGLRDGEYYTPLSGYRRQFKEKLGFVPFPGTLNVKVDEPGSRAMLEREKGVAIESFRVGRRFFGGAKCFPAIINKVRCAVIVPSRTHYGPEILEVIARENLRKKLNLKDGSRVSIEILR